LTPFVSAAVSNEITEEFLNTTRIIADRQGEGATPA
jgi:hypothetical protein